eukprot:TRINITY_DN1292_c0_g2_i4.p1 TRINITY_DN1292_c0_g2~~TRINITY_DN1292_c0_g2_i4.p1  ORF type:complete len:367 (-),score=109.27 TRINITY_DN1292_c0_g2_i4:217-1317(-)
MSGLTGTVKSWNGGKGFGFIVCAQVGGDVLFGREALPADVKEVRGNFLEGRPVVFDGAQGADGRFKATNVAVPYVEGKSLAGQIKSCSEKHGYGFITSSSLTEDVRFGIQDLPKGTSGDVKGELVLFDVAPKPDGKLQVSKLLFQSGKIATRVRGSTGGMMGGMAMGGMAMGGMGDANVQAAVQQAQSQGLMTGTVKSFSEKNGYGFISVPGYPMDVKFGKNDCTNAVGSGATVSFAPQQGFDGRVQATNVTSLGGGGATGGMKRTASMMMGGMGMMGMGMGAKAPKVEETATGRMGTGMIKSFNQAKGFGFISAAGVPGDIFFMLTSLPEEVRNTHGKEIQGRSCNFQISTTADGKVRAQDIKMM